MTRFSSFTDDELNMMEEAFCNEGLTYLVDEIRRERQIRQKGCYSMDAFARAIKDRK